MQSNHIEIPKPKNPEDVLDLMESFIEIVRILRRECPWDKKQTHQSISHLLIEESYEMTDAIEKGDDNSFSGELGDLLLHIVMHSVMAEERNAFDFREVIRKISEKMVKRHPHVFANTEVDGEDEVLSNWEKIKMTEGRKSTLEGVPNNLPALLRAERIQHKAARVGFDWDDRKDVWNKVEEELGELKHEIEAGNSEKIKEEIGDLFFAIVNAARFENVVAEDALQLTNKKFTNRFQFIEKRASEMNRKLDDMTLEEMDEIWNEAKALGIK